MSCVKCNNTGWCHSEHFHPTVRCDCGCETTYRATYSYEPTDPSAKDIWKLLNIGLFKPVLISVQNARHDDIIPHGLNSDKLFVMARDSNGNIATSVNVIPFVLTDGSKDKLNGKLVTPLVGNVRQVFTGDIYIVAAF